MVAINSLELWQSPQIYNLMKNIALSPCIDGTQIRKINRQSKTNKETLSMETPSERLQLLKQWEDFILHLHHCMNSIAASKRAPVIFKF